MLENGPYPIYLKKLIGSDKGHLSNHQAGLCALEFASPKLRRVILSHISKTNNTPELAYSTFCNIIKERSNLSPIINLSVREEPTELFKIWDNPANKCLKHANYSIKYDKCDNVFFEK